MKKNLLEIFPSNLRNMLRILVPAQIEHLQEIRLRINKPLIVYMKGKEYGINERGIQPVETAYKVQEQDLNAMMKMLTGFSLYAIDEDLKQGFMTIEGGHRVGFVGEMVVEQGQMKTIKHISGMNIRMAHEVIGCSKKVLPYIIKPKGIYHSLIVSPPKCGKTTLLRDIIRNLSNGENNCAPCNVGVVDERSEIAGCYKGVPQNDVGQRTDVLDRCPKVEGMRMLLRTMSPDIIAVDEIGSERDLYAIEEVLGSGVDIICTAHGKNLDDCMKKPVLRKMIEQNWFDKVIILSERKGPCTIENIIDLRKTKAGAL